jgi:hypothetical protein
MFVQDLYKNVYNSSIYNIPNLEKHQVSINKHVLYIHTVNSYYDMNNRKELKKHYGRWALVAHACNPKYLGS